MREVLVEAEGFSGNLNCDEREKRVITWASEEVLVRKRCRGASPSGRNEESTP